MILVSSAVSYSTSPKLKPDSASWSTSITLIRPPDLIRGPGICAVFEPEHPVECTRQMGSRGHSR